MQNEQSAQAREDLMAVLQASHAPALNALLASLRRRYGVQSGLLAEIDDPAPAAPSDNPWGQLVWDVDQYVIAGACGDDPLQNSAQIHAAGPGTRVTNIDIAKIGHENGTTSCLILYMRIVRCITHRPPATS